MKKKYHYSPYDPSTQQLWPHIQVAYVAVVRITAEDAIRRRLLRENKVYTLIVNATLIRALQESKTGAIHTRVSFQQHVDELIAVPNTRMLED